jgi:hypothetical protein
MECGGLPPRVATAGKPPRRGGLTPPGHSPLILFILFILFIHVHLDLAGEGHG